MNTNEAIVAKRAAARRARAQVLGGGSAAARETVERLACRGRSSSPRSNRRPATRWRCSPSSPTPSAGTVKITGDSKDYLSALTYVLNLSRADALSHVQLVRHEVKQNDPQRPVSFPISAAWNEVKK